MSDQQPPFDGAAPLLHPPARTAASFADSALNCWPAHLRLWVVTVAGLLADLLTKAWAFAELPLGRSKIVMPGVFRLQTSFNPGALWGMGKNMPWMRWVFIVASVFAMVFVLYVFSRSARGQRSFHVGLGLVLGGALGNLYDRIFNDGLVRDFLKIDVHIGTFALWPWIFNIADALLVAGVGLLLLNIWWDRSHARHTETRPR